MNTNYSYKNTDNFNRSIISAERFEIFKLEIFSDNIGNYNIRNVVTIIYYRIDNIRKIIKTYSFVHFFKINYCMSEEKVKLMNSNYLKNLNNPNNF